MSDAYDSPWKEVLQAYFPEFMAFFFPHIHRDVDWSRGYESLDLELPKIFREAETGKRVVDKLVKVWRRDGEEQIVFIHIEFQADYDPEFCHRMVVYHYRIFDLHRKAVVSLAVLGDDRPGWRPEQYRHELWGCELTLRFPMIKLWDYNERWAELEASVNPFATVVMIHLKTRATRRDQDGRLRWKLRLVRHLYERGFSRRDVEQLFRFLDWLMSLPESLEQRFDVELRRIEGETGMRYVTRFEQRAIDRGREQGIQLGRQEGREEGIQLGELSVLMRLLTRRFESLPAWAEERLEEASRQQLELWAERVIDAEALEDVFGSE